MEDWHDSQTTLDISSVAARIAALDTVLEARTANAVNGEAVCQPAVDGHLLDYVRSKRERCG